MARSKWKTVYRERATRVATAAALHGHELEAWPLQVPPAIEALGDGRRCWLHCTRCNLASVVVMLDDERAGRTMEDWMHQPCKPGFYAPPDGTTMVIVSSGEEDY